MRTTLSLDDDVVPLVKRYAEGRSLSLGKAVSELILKGLKAPLPTRIENGFVVFDVPSDSPSITLELVNRLRDEVE
jgi:hypothetical protein